MFSFNRRGGIRFLKIFRLNLQWSIAETQEQKDAKILAKRVKGIHHVATL